MRKSFLVIAADTAEQGNLQKMFSYDYSLTFADTADSAFQIMTDKEFPVIVFNMGRAKSGSLGELNALKTFRDKNPMIIALTTCNNLEIEKSIATIGVYYHLFKPYNEKDLLYLIDAATLAWQKKYLLSSVGGGA
jgi:DNA-binding NtrC family response regulator